MQQTTIEPVYFVCIRRSGMGPRSYPVVKMPDGKVVETTWAEYRASREVNLN